MTDARPAAVIVLAAGEGTRMKSARTPKVLHELLGKSDVKNYDGSWAEYGSLVGVPVQNDTRKKDV